jgi:predicted acylesterase/phospholipase RssA
LAACARLSNEAVVPATLTSEAEVPGMPNIRVFGDTASDKVAALLAAEAGRLRARFAPRPVSHILAISGGADDGAFSAGLIVGWGERGDRPIFDVVTGISAGSLVAPFAFLGRDFDRPLSAIFTVHGGDDIYRANPLSGLLGGPSVADNAPLAGLIAKYVDHRMLARVAVERAKGRFLFIGTTNLAAQRPVYWDMGRIAQVGTDAALQLFRDILLASAAVPGVFPPVPVTVMAGGRTFQEFHVDGGPTREVFISPVGFSFRSVDALVGAPIKRRLWVIRNGKLSPEYANVDLTAASIAVRALETLTKNQGLGDLLRIYDRARTDGMDFNLASIPPAFSEPRPSPFAQSYMTALYKTGHTLGRAGYRWAKSPPGAATAGPR